MYRIIRSLAAVWVLAAGVSFSVAGEAEKYLLRYQFHPGETLRWQVEHQSKVRATVSGSTQNTETLSRSVKTWRVGKVEPDGTATFEYRVDWVDMRQRLTGRSEVHYDSRTHTKPPPGFEDVARSVDVPLDSIRMNVNGKVLDRKRLKPRPTPTANKPSTPDESFLTIPLPEKPVPVGHDWSFPQQIDIPLPDGTVKKIKAVQRFELQKVETGVATIRVSTEILTPITDPAIEAQLVQREVSGVVRFDMDRGCILSQQMDIDKHVVGFRGDASSIHYVNRFSEKLLGKDEEKGMKDEG